MIKIVPDKEGRLTQWDLNRKVIVTGYEGVAEVHFASPGDDHGAYVVKLVDGQAEIPNILLTMAGTINVYVYPADRTVFATALWVMAREKPDDYVYTETEVLDWRTLDEKIGDLAELTTTARENLVAAINEAATKGMASIYMRVAEGYIEYSGDGVNWKQLIAVAELKGEKGDKGDPGSDATVDIVTPTAESTDTQAASAKAVWDMLGGGGGGTDISLGVTGALVGDIVKVKAVDSTGKPTAWEAAEMPSGDKWEILLQTTLTEEVSSVSADCSDNLCKKVGLIIETPAVDADTSYSYFEFDTNIAQPGGYIKSSFSPQAIPRKEKYREVFFGEVVKVGDYTYSKCTCFHGNEFNDSWDGSTAAKPTHNTTCSQMFKKYINTYGQPLGELIRKVSMRTYATFPVGTNITFFGVRA